MAQRSLFPEGPDVGSIIGGKYRLESKISEGGGGIVWNAVDPQDKRIALKLLKWSPIHSKRNAAERFKNEFSILKSLSHPNISEIYDFGKDAASGLYFFTSELIPGGDLRTLVKASIPELELLLLQALRSLEYLNNYKLLHLDIKPQNLLLKNPGKKPQLALIDFGLATFQPPDRPGGTANYMPPELIAKRLELEDYDYSHPDTRSDLYSLGVTFYFCLTGVQPFLARRADGKGIDPKATLRNHLTLDPPPPSTHRSEIPPYLDRIIMKLMARNPDDRYPSPIIAAQALKYSSPRKYPPESVQTLLAYLPKEGRLVGRHLERKYVQEALEAVARGEVPKASVICVEGGRGTGKSRLIKAFKPFAQRLEIDVDTIDDDMRDPSKDISRIDGKHLLLIDDIDKYIADSEVESSGSVHRSLSPYLKRIKLGRRLSSMKGGPHLLIFSLNSENNDVDEILDKLAIGGSICKKLKLANFDHDETAEYLTALLGESPDRSVVEQLMRCSDGNPLILTEQLEGMIAEGSLFSLAGRPDAETLKSIGIDFTQTLPPQSLTDTMEAKFEALSDEGRRTALVLSCWHRPASSDEISATAGIPSVIRPLLELTHAGIVKRRPKDGKFTFINPHARSIITGISDKKSMAALHDAVFSFLKAQRKIKREELLEHIAYGTRDSNRLDALSELSNKCLSEGKQMEAIAHLEEIVAKSGKDDWELKSHGLEKVGSVYEQMLKYDEARKVYAAIGKLIANADAAVSLKLKSLELVGRMEMRRRNLRKASRAFEEGLKITGRKKHLSVWRMRFENYLGGIDLRDGDIDKAIDRFRKSSEVAKKLLNPKERREIENNELGEALLRKGLAREALKVLKREFELAVSNSDTERIVQRHYLLGNALRSNALVDYAGARKHYMAGLMLARENRLLQMQIRIGNGLGNLFYMTDKPKDAFEHYEEAFRLSQQIDSDTTSVELMVGMGLAAQKLGKTDRTIEYFEAALDFSGGPKGEAAGIIRRYRPTIHVSLADAYYQQRDFEKAREYLDLAMALDKKETLPPDLRYSLYGTYAEMMLEYQDYDEAKRFMPTLRVIAKNLPGAKHHLEQLENSLK